jgi:predicted GNAT family acetyltransferase
VRFHDEYGYYELNDFPGNKNIVISNNVYIYPWHRNQGRGKDQHLHRLETARKMGYTRIICTVEEGNIYEKRILKANYWKMIGYVFSHESTNAEIWSRDL